MPALLLLMFCAGACSCNGTGGVGLAVPLRPSTGSLCQREQFGWALVVHCCTETLLSSRVGGVLAAGVAELQDTRQCRC
jgi:hypothetical protein